MTRSPIPLVTGSLLAASNGRGGCGRRIGSTRYRSAYRRVAWSGRFAGTSRRFLTDLYRSGDERSCQACNVRHFKINTVGRLVPASIWAPWKYAGGSDIAR